MSKCSSTAQACTKCGARFWKGEFTHRRNFTQKSFYTQKLLHGRLCTEEPLHRRAFTQNSLYTQKSFYTQTKMLHRRAFAQKSFYKKKSFYTKKFYCQCQNYRTEVEEYEGTVIYRTLLFYNSVFLGRYEKTYLNLLLTFFVVL